MPKPYTPQDILSLSVETENNGTMSLGAHLSLISYDTLMLGLADSPEADKIWREDAAHAMILEGYIDGELDNSGSVKDYDRRQLNTALEVAFDLLKQADYTSLDYPPKPKEYFVMEFYKNGEIAGHDSTPYTHEEAEKELEDYDSNNPYTTWRVVHISSVT